MTVPLRRKERSSKSEWRESVATCGLDQRSPPSSTSSSNFTHLLKQIIVKQYWCKKNNNKSNVYNTHDFLFSTLRVQYTSYDALQWWKHPLKKCTMTLHSRLFPTQNEYKFFTISDGSHLAVSFHSSSPPSISVSVSISLKRGWLRCVPSSSSSSPRMNCTRWLGGVTVLKVLYKYQILL